MSKGNSKKKPVKNLKEKRTAKVEKRKNKTTKEGCE